ncbi:MAG: tRNA glutamyl-Q(34) synthetase GluQRS [Akkermansia sp.]
MFRTRFAPSPSGAIHIGHLYAALEAKRVAEQLGGECLLRIEDIDSRCTAHWAQVLEHDLAWLGLSFAGDVMVQSQRMGVYAAALEQLKAMGLLYPCFCTRAEMKAQVQESGRAPHSTLGYQYEGRCKHRPADEIAELLAKGSPHAWRLDMQRAQELIGCPTWHDAHKGEQRATPSNFGDVVLARKEFPASYHLCVVIDDAAQHITHITRGEDLFEATHIHRTIQELLQLPTPEYIHHGLLRDEQGKRLAKRDGARAIASYREQGLSPEEVLQLVVSS